MNDTTNGNSGMLTGCRLYSATSGKGTKYLRGRLGGLSVLIFENQDAKDGEPSHVLKLGQAKNQGQSNAQR